ncbi:MAG: methyltransferase domain-containing protein [Verrucomicrobia bacterium]|nr:methyltransferase domain-containing protein [Verrucomicrobiota bacterium]
MVRIYETDKLLSEYLLFHYGTHKDVLPDGTAWPAGMHDALDFAVRTARVFPGDDAASGLDLGCAVGRSTFEMARSCRHVVGIDFSETFIQAATTLRDGGSLTYHRLEEAAVHTPLAAFAPAGIDRGRVDFRHGDAMDLPADLGLFDRVHAANLLCRLPHPQRLLDRLPSLLWPGGHLVLATPCTWLAGFTPPSEWPVPDTRTWLTQSLSASFELLDTREEPFLIRETARKFQWSLSWVTHWRRR